MYVYMYTGGGDNQKTGEKAKVVRQKEGEKEDGEEMDEDDEEVCV